MNVTMGVKIGEECMYCDLTVMNRHGSLSCENTECPTSWDDNRSWDDEDVTPFLLVRPNMEDSYPFELHVYRGDGRYGVFNPHKRSTVEFDLETLEYEVWNEQKAVR